MTIYTRSMSESIEMCKIVHFHGFQCPKLRVHLEPEVHDFAIMCINFSIKMFKETAR